jgi:hypothetical protein
MQDKQLEVKHCGTESKVAIGEALGFEQGGNAAPEKGGHEKHDQKKASAEGTASMRIQAKQKLAYEDWFPCPPLEKNSDGGYF